MLYACRHAQRLKSQAVNENLFPPAAFNNFITNSYSSKGDADAQSTKEHEAEGTKNGAGFLVTGFRAALGSTAAKVARVVGLNDEKELSDKETMAPAGWMQNKDRNKEAEEEYANLKESASEHWSETKNADKPNLRYPEHGKNA